MKIGLYTGDAGTPAKVREAVRGTPDEASVTMLDISNGLETIKPDSYDLLIVQCDNDLYQALPAIAELSKKNSRLAVLLLSPHESAEFLKDAMRANVREVLLTSATAQELRHSIDRVRERLTGNVIPKSHGKILAFISCKGGSGATFLAANLAYTLADFSHKKTLLIDLDLQYGDATFFIQGNHLTTSVTEIAAHSSQLDAGILTSNSLQVSPNLAFLGAPEEPEHAVGLLPSQIDQLLTVATQVYDFVVIDLERSFDALAIKVLDRADLVFPVIQLQVPHARNTRRLVKLLRSLGYTDEKVHLIANRADKNVDLPAGRIETAVGANIYRYIPNDFDSANASSSAGVSMLKHAPGSPVVKALKEFATELAGSEDHQKSWLTKFFRHATVSE
ncbi:MAG: AAA family ATPase [Burkholderiales bacterium]|nr:AAA family ATPase [Burkholderiales bacterium]